MQQPEGRKKLMPDWVLLLLIFAAYLALQRWILPRMGVST
jgi:hypothetical protein